MNISCIQVYIREEDTINTRSRTAVLACAFILFSAPAVIAADSRSELPSPAVNSQELDRTMRWLKNAVESISITLTPVDPDDGEQYYSHYSLDHEGCSVQFAYDFNYYRRMTRERKTTRIGSSFNLKDMDAPEAAPFYLTHIQTQLYSVTGSHFRIPVKDAGLAAQIAQRLDQARRLCRAMGGKD